ncbi:MAG: SIR2 family protein [Rhodobacteraceae bacterium]|nr:SIR2 family protein [Paracoccaceae bacterium]
MPDEVPEQIKPYLDEIANRLWSGNAAVMVGAGFSRNAKPVDSTAASFPTWQELGDVFYKKLHGRPPGEDARYMSLLKLADQIQAAFGRPALDELLRRAIPNLGYEPSSVHNKLLDLPWKDVFTTNYDTLLERARASVTLKHYDVVATDQDLLYANQPRIVKLHGSFPSPPFVVTEEDYRRYPRDHAPFVNTVRQSLLENTLCLMGFSGDDPNFLQWIGWIRDHIGRATAPKIYLVGMFHALTEAERRLLDDRSIVVVDLSGFRMDPGRAVGAFLDYLKSGKTRAADWPIVSADVRSWASEAKPEKYREITVEWRRQRGEYPGWVVMPEDRRNFLWFYTKEWLWHLSQVPLIDLVSLETPLDLDLAYELAWRLERCLFPLTSELEAFLGDIATKYGDETLPLPARSGWTRSSVEKAVADIRLWLLRHYREEGLVERWQEVRRTIRHGFERLLPEQRARLLLEEALHALFQFDPAEAKRLLVDWQSTETLPFWEAKRAALMAELGEIAAAHSILEASLSALRQQLGLNPVIEDYTLVSQESVVMLLLWAVEHGRSRTELYSDEGSLRNELSERWNELKRYKCDPHQEIASLSASLRHRSEGRGQESTTHSFDLGRTSTTIHFGFDEEIAAAYGLLRMYEDLGMPYRVEHTYFVRKRIESTLPRIRSYSPHWALANIVRVGDQEAADGLFDREYLARLQREEVDGLFQIYLPAFERAIAMVNEPDDSEAKTIELVAKTVPEVFSRLCYKCSPEFRERLLDALEAIYASKRRNVFTRVNRFVERLFGSMSIAEHARAAPLLIDFPPPNDLSDIEKQEFVNPLLALDPQVLVRGDALAVTPEKIDELLNKAGNDAQERDWTATKLAWLHGRDKLSQRQSEHLGELLWDGIEAPGVPIIAGYCTYKCIELPHPAEIDPVKRVKQRLLTILGDRSEDSRLDDVLDELHRSARVVGWSQTEAFELAATLLRWWNENKLQLNYRMPTPFGAPAQNVKRITRKAVMALSSVFSQLQADNNGEERVAELRELLADLAARDMPTMELEAAALSVIPDVRTQVTERVAAAMFDKERDVVVDALRAAGVLVRGSTQEETRGGLALVITMLVQGVQWRHRPALAGRLSVIADLVENQPWFLSAEVLASLLAGLKEIAEETSNGVAGNDQDGVIIIRASAASLAFALFEYFQESGSEESEQIRRWREICSDPNEFSEVRNAWRVVGKRRS